MQVKLDAYETKELRLAVIERADGLEKLRAKMMKTGVSITEIDGHILALKGDDSQSGLIGRLSEQLTLLEKDLFE